MPEESVLLDWKHYRVISSRFPPINLFDQESEKFNTLMAELETLTADRLHRWREFVAEDDFRSGSGWGAVMASFCYVSPGRFNDSRMGAYYCSNSIKTSITEWGYHTGKSWHHFGLTDEVSAVVRAYTGHFKHSLIDLRNDPKVHGDEYAYPQAKANLLRVDGASGVVYNSVRHEGGICVALFRPPATTPVTQAAHYCLNWNGEVFTSFAKLSAYETL
jgi:RES domain-containing protein